jgi:hypothetical protein
VWVVTSFLLLRRLVGVLAAKPGLKTARRAHGGPNS